MSTVFVDGVTPLNAANMNALLQRPPIGTTLPGSPTDGQQAILVDSITNPTYNWLFRYNAGSTSPYKWEFIGGLPLWAQDATQRTVAASAPWADVTGTTLSLSAPRAGEYDCTVMAQPQNTGATASQILLGLSLGGVDPGGSDYLTHYTSVNGMLASLQWTYFAKALAAAAVIKPRYQAQLAGTFARMTIWVIPRRVS